MIRIKIFKCYLDPASTNSSVSITRTSQGAVSNYRHWNAKAEHCQETQLEIIQLLMLFSYAQSSFFRKHYGDYYEKIALSCRSLQTSSLPFHLAFGLPCAVPGKYCLIAESLQSRMQKIAVYLISTPYRCWYWIILILKMLKKQNDFKHLMTVPSSFNSIQHKLWNNL